MNELRDSRRIKSFMRGFIYDCRKRGAMDCLIRDLSESGARIALSDAVALPEVVELDIPQRELRRRARVSGAGTMKPVYVSARRRTRLRLPPR